MKKIFSLSTIVFATLALSSCEKFLDVVPEGSPTIDSYFQIDQQAVDAVKSLYADITEEDSFGREIFWEQCASNMYVSGRNRGYGNTLFTLQYTGDESPLTTNFNRTYKFMARANWIIQSLKEKETKNEGGLSAVEKRSLGEAYFFRAFFHYLMAYRYGTGELGVPFVQWEKWAAEHEGAKYNFEIPPQLPSVKDNYAKIIEDLTEAESYLPEFGTYGPEDRGRAHKAAAVAMMARIYAYWATWDNTQWSNVIPCVDKLEKTYGRKLEPDYNRLFSCEFEDFWTDEYCWSFPANGGIGIVRAGTMFAGVCLENKGWGIYNGWGQFKPTYDIYEEFLKDGSREENIRLKRSILAYGDKFIFNKEEREYSSTSDYVVGLQINKWMDAFAKELVKADGTSGDAILQGYVNSSGDWPTTRCNFHVIRFADCLLLRAEANLNLGKDDQALVDINRVRERSKLEPKTSVTVADIYHERMCELAFEPAADHLADIKRWAVSAKEPLKTLAITELTTQPRVIFHKDRSNPHSEIEKIDFYEDYNLPREWKDYKIGFPYPSNEVTKSNGALKQNPGW